MVTIVTGMVGVDKKPFLAEVARLADERGRGLAVFNVGEMMYAEASDITPGRILDIPLKRLHSLRRSVIKDIINRAGEFDDVVVNTHATFRWRHGLFPAFDFDQLRQLRPGMFVCIIDGVTALHARLSSEHLHIKHSLKDLLVWREEEMLATEMMASGSVEDAEVYALARGIERANSETLYRLICDRGRKRAYLSFPMTLVAGLDGVQGAIGEFRDVMKEHFICFDPADLEEAYLPYLAREASEEKGEVCIEVDGCGEKVRLDADEVLGIESDINSQIYARDFALIDQSEMIISFIPPMPDGMPAISSGVERELQHAHEASKEVYVIWTASKEPSVFVTQTASAVFRGTVEAVEYFKEKGYL